MPDASQVQPVNFPLQGGLVLNKSTFAMQPGEALELQNFEPDIEGGYRRINGFAKLVTNIVPQTSASTEAVLLSIKFNDFVPKKQVKSESIPVRAEQDMADDDLPF